MLKKIMLLILLAVFFLGSASLFNGKSSVDVPMRTINVNIVEDSDGIWRVRDNNGRGQGTIQTRSADSIFWMAKKSAAVFFFPKNVDDYFEYDEGLFKDGRSQRIEANKKLRLTIKDDAPATKMEYQVYVESAEKYVVGNSPPVLIINRAE